MNDSYLIRFINGNHYECITLTKFGEGCSSLCRRLSSHTKNKIAKVKNTNFGKKVLVKMDKEEEIDQMDTDEILARKGEELEKKNEHELVKMDEEEIAQMDTDEIMARQGDELEKKNEDELVKMDEKEISEMDTDEIMARQGNELEKKNELKVKLKTRKILIRGLNRSIKNEDVRKLIEEYGQVNVYYNV